MRFLLVEDNQELASAVVERLQLDSHVVDHANDLQSAFDFTATTDYDLILLDIMLPDGDGRTFLQRRRAGASQTPVIVLTARSQVSDRVGLLDLGADDYMVKPIDFSELEARCRAVLRRKGGSARNIITHGGLIFDPVAGALTIDGQEISLRTRELRLLEIFLNNPSKIIPKSKLMDRLFSYDEEATENAIEVYVARLRRHLAPSIVSIKTIRGSGYKLDVSQ